MSGNKSKSNKKPPEKKMQEDLNALIDLIPEIKAMKAQIVELTTTAKKTWKWITGNTEKGAAENLRDLNKSLKEHEEFIQELKDEREAKSNWLKRLFTENVFAVIAGIVLAMISYGFFMLIEHLGF